MAFILSRSLKCIIFLSSAGLLELRTRLDRRGACTSDISRNKVFHFSHISLRLCTPLRSSHDWAKMSERKLLRLKFLNCLYISNSASSLDNRRWRNLAVDDHQSVIADSNMRHPRTSGIVWKISKITSIRVLLNGVILVGSVISCFKL